MKFILTSSLRTNTNKQAQLHLTSVMGRELVYPSGAKLCAYEPVNLYLSLKHCGASWAEGARRVFFFLIRPLLAPKFLLLLREVGVVGEVGEVRPDVPMPLAGVESLEGSCFIETLKAKKTFRTTILYKDIS